MANKLEIYHHIWLECHPHRSENWLIERLKDGFDIHHLDGNHDNNDPKNLALIEHTDHMMIHGMSGLGRLTYRKKPWQRLECGLSAETCLELMPIPKPFPVILAKTQSRAKMRLNVPINRNKARAKTIWKEVLRDLAK